ncbi:SH3 domain-containing protein [Paraglaciecola arctica]|uniref:SH3 domain-containing protein n=1 Tax=Paraglaciecola arctica TaxID=1128911 RepID=UPI001C073545|nr:SH3 domain-containing protein [Paraglaciecola arctica]MBU3004762.1 SH3 domain-containing protein [Paraglaciecola arctica]
MLLSGKQGLFEVNSLGALVVGFLVFISFQVLAEGEAQVQVIEPFIEMHSGPAGGFPVIHVAAKNEWITVLKRRTNWFKVETNKGVQGWIKQDTLHKTVSISGDPVSLADGSFDSFSQRNFEFGALGGSFEGVPSMTVFADWVATENLMAGITLTQALGDLSENQLFLVRVQHTTFPDWLLSPYVTLGAGKIRTKPRANLVQSGDETRTSDLLAAGLGLRYYVAQNFILKLEYQHLQALTNRDENEELEQWTLGFAVFF